MAKIKHKIETKKLEDLPIIGEKPENEREEKYLKEICEYEFQNIKEPGSSISFPYGSTKNYVVFDFKHGQKYKVPRHIARHVEKCSTPIYKWKPDGNGSLEKNITGTDSRFQMRPVFK